ncbi:hypothetical protein DV735_g1027, partial [Chaetothyriales sp. CBS 134920]
MTMSSTPSKSGQPSEVTTLLCDDKGLSEYTSGRWLWNEKKQLDCRRVLFSVTELAKAATKATGSNSCIDITKLPEGNFNKVFLMVMDDGKEIIAKLPNPNAGRPHLTTASEVATMDFVRNVLKVPAPRVYAWDSSSANPVGAEYILMERVAGVELDKVWDDMPGEKRFQVVQKLAKYDAAFATSGLSMYGSLYYADDVPDARPSQLIQHGQQSAQFAIGPTTNRAYFDNLRAEVDLDLGPWSTFDEYIRSRTEREHKCISRFNQFPRQQGLFSGPGQYKPTAAAKSRVLTMFSQAAPLLTPKDPSLVKPTLWHPDLHTENIFVDPDNPTNIVSIIDWQAVNIAPLFLQARHPSLIEFEGPITKGFEPINLPDDFESLSPEKQLEAKKLRSAQSLYKLYEVCLLQTCPEIFKALQVRESLPGQIFGLAGSIFSDGEPVLLGMLIRMHDEWVKTRGSSPLGITLDDRENQKEDMRLWSQGVELLADFLAKVGAYQGWDGWVNHNNYEVMRLRLQHCIESFLDQHATTEEKRRLWRTVLPFKDDDPEL